MKIEIIRKLASRAAELEEINAALVAALKNLAEQVRSHQRPHNCPGFDCSTCTPVEALSDAEAALALAKGEK